MTRQRRATRGRPGRIDGFAGTHREIKDRIDALLRANVSQAEILRRLDEPLRAVGERPLSAAGLNRYASGMEEVGREIREINAFADVWTAKAGERPMGNVSAMTLQILQTLAFRKAMQVRRGEDEEIDTSAIGELALSLQRLERSASLNAAREREIREEVAARAGEIAAAQAARAGLSDGAAAEIRAAIEGAAG